MKCEISAESAIIYFHMPNILQTVLDASPLL